MLNYIYLIINGGDLMNKNLKKQYMRAILRFRKVGMILPQAADLNMTELVVMRGLEKNCPDSNSNTGIAEVQKQLHITKSAISQMMTSLEKKGYIERTIDPDDRRKRVVTLTKTGKDILNKTKKATNHNLNEILSGLGEENTKQFINLLNQVSDISEHLKKEEKT